MKGVYREGLFNSLFHVMALCKQLKTAFILQLGNNLLSTGSLTQIFLVSVQRDVGEIEGPKSQKIVQTDSGQGSRTL